MVQVKKLKKENKLMEKQLKKIMKTKKQIVFLKAFDGFMTDVL